jgi:hypothetical protein
MQVMCVRAAYPIFHALRLRTATPHTSPRCVCAGWHGPVSKGMTVRVESSSSRPANFGAMSQTMMKPSRPEGATAEKEAGVFEQPSTGT